MMIDFSQFGYAVGPTANLTCLCIAVHGFAFHQNANLSVSYSSAPVFANPTSANPKYQYES